MPSDLPSRKAVGSLVDIITHEPPSAIITLAPGRPFLPERGQTCHFFSVRCIHLSLSTQQLPTFLFADFPLPPFPSLSSSSPPNHRHLGTELVVYLHSPGTHPRHALLPRKTPTPPSHQDLPPRHDPPRRRPLHRLFPPAGRPLPRRQPPPASSDSHNTWRWRHHHHRQLRPRPAPAQAPLAGRDLPRRPRNGEVRVRRRPGRGQEEEGGDGGHAGDRESRDRRRGGRHPAPRAAYLLQRQRRGGTGGRVRARACVQGHR